MTVIVEEQQQLNAQPEALEEIFVFTKFVTFTKVSNEEERIVEGYISEEAIDSQNQMVDFDGLCEALQEYLKLGNVREMHQPSAVGKVIKVWIDKAARKVKVAVKVVDDLAWKKVKEGVYNGFSIGGKTLPGGILVAKKEDGSTFERLVRFVVDELSLVDRPAAAGALFTLWKFSGATMQQNNVIDMTTNSDPASGEGEATAANTTTAAVENSAEVAKAAGQDTTAPKAKTPAKKKAASAVAAEPVQKAAKAAAGDDEEEGDMTDADPKTIVAEIQALRNKYELGGNFDAAQMLTEAIANVLAAEEDQEADASGGDGDEDDASFQAEGADNSMAGADSGTDQEAANQPLQMASRILDVVKAGRAISGTNMQKIQAIHDTAASMGAACGPAGDSDSAGGGDMAQASKASKAADVVKVAGTGAEVFTKAFEPVFEKFTSALDNISKRLERLEAQPMPGGPALMQGGGAINKSLPGLGGGSGSNGSGEPSLDAQIEKMRAEVAQAPNEPVRKFLQEQLATLEVKKAQQSQAFSYWR